MEDLKPRRFEKRFKKKRIKIRKLEKFPFIPAVLSSLRIARYASVTISR